MDRQVVAAKIESLRRCIQRIQDRRPGSADAFVDDFDLQDIISVNLQRAVQICADIAAHILATSEEEPPETQGETFDALARLDVIPQNLGTQLRGAVGFRNIAVYAYREIDWAIVY